MEPSSSLLTCLSKAPNEVFINAITIDGIKKPIQSAITLSFLKRIDKKIIGKKATKCLDELIKNTRILSILVSPLTPSIFKNQKEELAKITQKFPILKIWKHLDLYKWVNATPLVSEYTVEGGGAKQCIANGTLSIVDGGHINRLCLLDLMTQKKTFLHLGKPILPTPTICFPFLVSTDEWFAISCNFDYATTIYIMSKNSKKCLHEISSIGIIKQMVVENEFLYILCKDFTGSKLLRFNSKNWESEPQKLILAQRDITSFILGTNEIFFCSSNKKNYELIAVKKECCFFKDKNRDFFIAKSEKAPSLLRFSEDIPLTITPGENEESLALLESLHLEESKIVKKCVVKLPIKIAHMVDFCVQFDKVFVLLKSQAQIILKCYDLNTGELVREYFPDEKPELINPKISPVIVPLPGKGIKVIYSAKNELNSKGTIAMMELDFSICK